MLLLPVLDPLSPDVRRNVRFKACLVHNRTNAEREEIRRIDKQAES